MMKEIFSFFFFFFFLKICDPLKPIVEASAISIYASQVWRSSFADIKGGLQAFFTLQWFSVLTETIAYFSLLRPMSSLFREFYLYFRQFIIIIFKKEKTCPLLLALVLR